MRTYLEGCPLVVGRSLGLEDKQPLWALAQWGWVAKVLGRPTKYQRVALRWRMRCTAWLGDARVKGGAPNGYHYPNSSHSKTRAICGLCPLTRSIQKV